MKAKWILHKSVKHKVSKGRKGYTYDFYFGDSWIGAFTNLEEKMSKTKLDHWKKEILQAWKHRKEE